MTVASRTLARGAANTLKHRKSVAKLTVKQLTDLRRAFEAVLPINDERGYNYHAGIHGLPLPMYCEHGTLLFLPWHRAYLYFFELALRDQVKTVSLPWWNWASAGSRTNGIPESYADRRVDSKANPLFSAPIPPVARVGGRPRKSFRQPRDPSLLPTQQDVQDVLDEPDFRGFSDKVEVLHNGVHVWIGGTTAQVPWAAYDPLFWAHHSMIDRLWRLWQLRHPDVGIDSDLLTQALPPFPMTVADTLDVNALGYEYASSTARVAGRV